MSFATHNSSVLVNSTAMDLFLENISSVCQKAKINGSMFTGTQEDKVTYTQLTQLWHNLFAYEIRDCLLLMLSDVSLMLTALFPPKKLVLILF